MEMTKTRQAHIRAELIGSDADVEMSGRSDDLLLMLTSMVEHYINEVPENWEAVNAVLHDVLDNTQPEELWEERRRSARRWRFITDAILVFALIGVFLYIALCAGWVRPM